MPILTIKNKLIRIKIVNLRGESTEIKKGSPLGTLLYEENENIEINSMKSQDPPDYSEPESTENIDEEITNELVVVDPTNLDKKFTFKQCFGSGSAWIRIQLVARIRIRIRNADPDPDPGGLKRAKMKKKRSKKPDN
jgi:hypothetical protein